MNDWHDESFSPELDLDSICLKHELLSHEDLGK